MASSSSNRGKPTREQKREEKQQKKAAKGPGYFAQLKQVYSMTKKADPSITWILLGAVVVTLVVFLGIGLLLHNWLTFLLIGIPVAVLVAVIILSRRARRAAYAQVEGQPGAAGASLQDLGRGWIYEEQPVAVNPRSQDLVFRALGRPGVVLVTEGPKSRVTSMVNQERKRINRIAPNVPVHVVNTGNGEGQVPLKKVSKTIRGLDKTLTQQEVHAVNNRLSSLNRSMPVPKGVDPMKARPDRRGMRGR